jgi:hypothetical protein
MGKEVVRTERLLLSGQRSSHVSCRTLASDPLMAAILTITPKDKAAPFRYLRATYFPEEDKFRFFVYQKGDTRLSFAGVYHEGKFFGDYKVLDFERDVITWVCVGGLPEIVEVIPAMYSSHTKAQNQES